MSLQNPRRIVVGHNSDGSVLIKDDELTPTSVPGGNALTMAYVQKSFIGKPVEEGLMGTTLMPEAGFIQPGGVAVAWLDFPPGMDSGRHFTNSIDYIVCLSGTLDLELNDGSKKTVNPGDLVVQLAGIHRWVNNTDQTTRLLGLCLPAEPVKVDGKGLDEAPFNAQKYC